MSEGGGFNIKGMLYFNVENWGKWYEEDGDEYYLEYLLIRWVCVFEFFYFNIGSVFGYIVVYMWDRFFCLWCFGNGENGIYCG